MVDDGQTHYEMLGVDPGASKDDIRAAYQERLDDVQAERTREQAGKRPDDAVIARGRDEEARLRAAWGVLSDPYQRGRYDATVGVPDAEGHATDDPAAAESTNGRTPARRERRPRPQRRERPPGMFSTEPLATPASWPPGFHPPPPRARFMAMLIDITVLLVILIGLYVASGAVAKSAYPKETKQLDAVSTQLTDIQTCIDNRPKIPKSENALKVCQTSDHKALTKKQLEKVQTKFQDQQTSLRNKVAPVTTYGLFGAILLASLLYLVPSSLRSGRTFGKRLFQIRVIQMNGAPLGLRAAITRYGLPLVFALMLQGFLGPLAYAFALIGVLTWPRNANLQGLHDRVAGTIVVDG